MAVTLKTESKLTGSFLQELQSNISSDAIPQTIEIILIAVLNCLEPDEKEEFLNDLPDFIKFNKNNALLKQDSKYEIDSLFDVAERAYQINKNYPESIFRNKQQALAHIIILLNILNNYMECEHLDSLLSLDIY